MLKSINTFIEKASKNKLWTFGWLVLVACAAFTVRFFIDYPSQQALMDGNTARFNTYTQDYEDFLQVEQILKDSYSSFLPVLKDYNAIINKVNNKEIVSVDEVNKAKANTESAKISLATAIGTLSGVHFNDEKVDKYVSSFSTNLKNKDEIVDVVLMFYQGLLEGNQEKVKSSAEAITAYNVDVYRQEAEAIETQNTFSKEFENFHAKSMIEITKETNNLVLYEYKMKLVIPTLAYTIIFPCVGIYSWLKNSRMSKKKVKKKSKSK